MPPGGLGGLLVGLTLLELVRLLPGTVRFLLPLPLGGDGCRVAACPGPELEDPSLPQPEVWL